MTCLVDGCRHNVHAWGLCRTHYVANRSAAPCTQPGCDRPMYARALCRTHWGQWRDDLLAQPCAVADCGQQVIGQHVCDTCIAWWQRIDGEWQAASNSRSGWWEPDRPTPCTTFTAGDLWFDEDQRKAAAFLCSLCPLQAECLKAAQEAKATCGTWAGKWFGADR